MSKTQRDHAKYAFEQEIVAGHARSHKGRKELSQEFCELVRGADEHASNDDYYVTSADFIELHSRIRGGLLYGLLLWTTGLFASVILMVVAFK